MHDFVALPQSQYLFEEPPEDDDEVGDQTNGGGHNLVGVFISQHDAQHVGLIYVSGVKTVNALHLVTNNKLEDKQIALNAAQCKKYIVAPIPMHSLVALPFCAYLRATVKKCPSIRYGINWAGAMGSFDKESNYTPPVSSDGLTCATFVSEVIAGFGMPAVDPQTWPKDTQNDKKWQKAQVERFRTNQRTTMPPDVIDDMESVSPIQRLQPSQIAAALASDTSAWEMKYEEVTALAQKVVDTFNKAFPETV